MLHCRLQSSKRQVRDWPIVSQLVFIQGRFLRGDWPIVDSLRMRWKVPEPRERLTMLIIVGMSTEEHFFEKPSGYRVRIRLFVGTVEQDLIDFRFRCRPEGRKKNRC